MVAWEREQKLTVRELIYLFSVRISTYGLPYNDKPIFYAGLQLLKQEAKNYSTLMDPRHSVDLKKRLVPIAMGYG